jgi:hypothetical protein
MLISLMDCEYNLITVKVNFFFKKKVTNIKIYFFSIGYIRIYYKGVFLKMNGMLHYLGHVMDTRFLNKGPKIAG